jgi:hypothetical protein
LTGIRNVLLRLDTETSSVATTADGTTVDSAGSQEVDDTYESVGVPVATTTAGEDDNRIVMDGLGVSMSPGQDEGHNSVDILDRGTSSTTPSGGTPGSISTNVIRLAIPTDSSHSRDDSELEGSHHGVTTVSTPNTSTRAQEHSSAGETSNFATPGEVQPNRMDQFTTDSEDFLTELRLGLAQIVCK